MKHSVRINLDTPSSNLTHGLSSKCPDVIIGRFPRCMGHIMPRQIDITLEFDPETEAALMRAFSCNQHALPLALSSVIDAVLGQYAIRGSVGLRGDALVKSGDIEVGRPMAL